MAARARVTFSFNPNAPDELALAEGEYVTVLERYPDGWCKGELNGRVGVFPETFIKFESVDETKPNPSLLASGSGSSKGYKAVVIFHFAATNPNQLTLELGQEVTVLEDLGKGWAKGEINGKVGIFPGGYVKKADEAGQSTPATQGQVTETEAVAIHGYTGAKEKQQLSFEAGATLIIMGKLNGGWWKGKLASTGEVGIFPGSYVKEKTPGDPSTPTTQPAQGPVFKASVIHSFPASAPQHLTLEVGQTVNVLRELPNGWWYGEVDGKAGIFPMAYTKKLTPGAAALATPTSSSISTPPSQATPSTAKIWIAQFDFNLGGEQAGKLSFKKGDQIMFIQELEKGWSRGEKDGKQGIFPTNYAAPQTDAPSSSPQTQASQPQPTPPASQPVPPPQPPKPEQPTENKTETTTSTTQPPATSSGGPPPPPPPQPSSGGPPPPPPMGAKSKPIPSSIEPKTTQSAAPKTEPKKQPTMDLGSELASVLKNRNSKPAEPQKHTTTDDHFHQQQHHSTTAVVNKNDHGGGASNEEVQQLKKAMTTLQSQSKQAIDGMMARIDKQQQDFLSLVQAMKELQHRLNEEQNKTKLLEQQNSYLYKELQSLKGSSSK
eukprot:TRINITY_DN12187_c0_g1_i1.p1 TRINITY_DN12187_c0_g1~~TRINITY_DN12187_c0_g1_i1.p1  ORF type:complete len:604 (-),score=209.72 TRINITY_DN12187_c0_g1_i1:79-1890(-)